MLRIAALTLISAGLLAGEAFSQSFPERPIRYVVGAAPGGGNDIVARVINPRLAETLGAPVVIDNRGGAGGVLATDLVARAPADGYTLLQVFTNFAIFPSLHEKLAFDVSKDFIPIIHIASTPLILVIHPSVPAKSVPELIEHARAKKGGLNFAAPGVGSLGHLAGELFKTMAKIEMVHIAYKGGGPAITALLGNEVQLYFSTVPAAITQVRADRLRALGVTGLKRAAAAPDVPTIAEQGLSGYEVDGWFGLFAPAGTPQSVVKVINSSINRVLAAPEIKERLANAGVEPGGGTPVEFAKRVQQDIKKWNTVAKQAGVRPGM